MVSKSTQRLPSVAGSVGPSAVRGAAAVTALVVDDNPSLRELLTFALQRIPGVSVVEAGDGMEALAKLEASQPDIIFTDINMPVMDGLSFLKRVRAMERFRDTPVVVITTEKGAVDRARALTYGASSYITKPVRAQSVRREVERLLAR